MTTNRNLRFLLATGLYLALAILWTLPVWVGGGRLLGVGLGYGVGDPIQRAWSTAWTPFAISHGINPFYTTFLHAPLGLNYMWPAPDVAFNLLAWPVTALLGVESGFNAQIVIGIVASALGFYMLALRWTSRWWLAVLGGAMFGFSPYVVSEVVMGHSYLMEMMAIPVIALALDEMLLRQSWSPRRVGFLLGGAVTVQLVTSEELLLDVFIVVVLGVTLLALLNLDEVPKRFGYVTRCILWSGLLAPVFVGLLGFQLLGPNALHGNVFDGSAWTAPPVTFFLPNSYQLLTTSSSSYLTWRSFAGLPELSTYIGLPVIAMMLIAITRWRSKQLAWLSAMILVSICLAMGGMLIAAHFISLSLLFSDIPVRFSAITDLLVVLMVVFVADYGLSAWRWPMRFLLCLIVASWLPALAVPFSSPSVPKWFSDGVHLRSSNSVVLVLPYAFSPQTDIAMLWQAESGMRFRMPEGYFTGESLAVDSYHDKGALPFIKELMSLDAGSLKNKSHAILERSAHQYFRDTGVRYVVIGPSAHERVQLQVIRSLLRVRGREVAGVFLFNVGA